MRVVSISRNGINFIKKWEKFMPNPYLCQAGIPTIGYGSTFYEDGRRVRMSDPPITELRAEMLLINVLRDFCLAVDSFTRDDINQNQFDALVSICYNIGIKALQTSTLLKLVNINPNNKEIGKWFMVWNKVHNPKTKKLEVSKGLVNRRKEEVELYFS